MVHFIFFSHQNLFRAVMGMRTDLHAFSGHGVLLAVALTVVAIAAS